MTASAGLMKRILVLDDEFVVLDFCKRLFSREGFPFDLAANMEQADELLRSSTAYDLLICDLCLPDGNGADFTNTFKHRCPDANLIVMTGIPHLFADVTSRKLGQVEYIVKPFGIKNFLRLVRKGLGLNHWLGEGSDVTETLDWRKK
jgi:two-component system, NtrC family, response regulator